MTETQDRYMLGYGRNIPLFNLLYNEVYGYPAQQIDVRKHQGYVWALEPFMFDFLKPKSLSNYCSEQAIAAIMKLPNLYWALEVLKMVLSLPAGNDLRTDRIGTLAVHRAICEERRKLRVAMEEHGLPATLDQYTAEHGIKAALLGVVLWDPREGKVLINPIVEFNEPEPEDY